MNEIEFCRACLIIDVKMILVKKSHMLKFYSKLIGNSKAPLLLCYECVILLDKCKSFHDKCIKASNVLKLITTSQSMITKDALRMLDRNKYCLESYLSMASVETCEFPIATDESKRKNKCTLLVLHRSKNVPFSASDTIKVEDGNIISSDSGPLKNSFASEVDREMNEIKNVILIQDGGIESDALSHSTPITPFGTGDNLPSNKFETNKLIDTQKTRTRLKRKQRFLTENVNKSYKTKRTNLRRNMKSIENRSIDKRMTAKSLIRNINLEIKTNNDIKKNVEPHEDIFNDGYTSVELLSNDKTQNQISLKERDKVKEEIGEVRELGNSCNTLKCHKDFNSEGFHIEHMKRRSSDGGSFKCDYCHKIFQKQCELIKHHSSDHRYKYSSKMCPFTSTSSPDVKAHVTLHKDEEVKLENDVTDTADDELNDGMSDPEENVREKNGKVRKIARSGGPPFDASYFEGYATFVLLTPEQALTEIYSRKETPNYMYSQFKCELCFRGFESKITYQNHMKKHSPEHGEYECEFCHFRFRNQRYLNKHKLGAHRRKFSCKICSFVCFCSDQAKVHVKLHKGTKYPCKDCGEIFNMPNSLLMHKRKKHLTSVVCDLCGSTFNTERGVKSHKLIRHREETNPRLGPVCDLCDVHFANEAAWKKHIVLSAKHFVSNGCQHCGETFETENALKIHVRVHARKPRRTRNECRLPGDCAMCGETLPNETERRKHLLTAHPNSKAAQSAQAAETPQCVCEICGKMFKKLCFLNYHMRMHTGKKPYTCTDCGKSYAYPGVLSEHKATHMSHPQHRCHLCPKIFKFKSALYKHVKAHLGIRPHKCHICDKSFPTPCELRTHTHHTHHKVPWPKRERRRQRKSTQSTSREIYGYDN